MTGKEVCRAEHDKEAYLLKGNTVKIRTWRQENGAALGVVCKEPERPAFLLNTCTLLSS
jgi:hypothetical protein